MGVMLQCKSCVVRAEHVKRPLAEGQSLHQRSQSSSGTFCTEVALAAGQTVTVHVVNQLPQGGGTRTIGYWKNWSTCTNGRQAEQALARNMPGLLLDTYLNGSGYYGGIYPIGLIVGMDAQPDLTCIQAVRLLSKDAIDGTRRPGDPVYNLVAQLLGAKLNLAAGAGTCATLTTALSQAHTLLTTLGFDGTGAYRGTLTSEQQAQANALAGTFGSYNEGTLGGGCPMHQ